MMKSNRALTLAAAAAMFGAFAAVPALAQRATSGPAGGVATTTAPSNSEGTPAGGTGVISSTRVGPNGSVPVTPPNTTPARTLSSAKPKPPARHVPRQTGTQSQTGLGNSVVAPK